MKQAVCRNPKCKAAFSLPKNKRKFYCSKICQNRVASKRWRLTNPEKVIQKRADNWEDMAFYRLRWRAKKTNLSFNLEKEDIIIPESCSVLGIPIVKACGQGSGYHPNAPSVDRIKPELGYIKGNVRVISARANLLKNDATVEELEKVLADIKSL